jgi:HlyD family secretion protein
MRKRLVLIIALLLVSVVSILAITLFSKKSPEFSFETARVTKGRITNVVTATGTIEAITTVNVGTQVSGIIRHIYVDFNDKVKKGQVLAQIDETVLKAQVDQGQAAVDQAQAEYNFQKATFDRLKVLFEKNLIAQSDYDQALYNFQNSKAALSNARSSLSRAKVNLAYATIYSPIDGVVLNRAIEEGQTVAASFNTPTLFTIVNDLTQMEVQTSVDEADIGKVKKGQRVEFTVDAYPDMKFEGEVSQVRLQPITTNNVVTYNVILRAPNPDKKLMPGMTASATIFVQEDDNALIVSGRALRFRPDEEYMKKEMANAPGGSSGRNSTGAAMPGPSRTGNRFQGGNPDSGFRNPGNEMASSNAPKSVWIRTDSLSIHRVPVRVGIDNGTNAEILSGLKEGEEVVVAMTDSKSRPEEQTQNTRRRPFIL